MPALNFFVYLVNILVFTFLGVLVIFHNPRRGLNKVFGLIIFMVTFWVLSNFMADSVKTYELALFWTRMALVGPIVLSPALLHFAYIFPVGKFESSLSKKLIWLIPSILLFFIPTRINVEGVILHDWGVEYFPGPLYTVFGLFFVAYLVATSIVFIRKYPNLSSSEKTHVRLFVLSISLTVSLGVLFTLVLPLFGFSRLAILGPSSAVVMFTTLTYTVVKHRLMDIRLAVRAFLIKLLVAVVYVSCGYVLTLLYLFDYYQATLGNMIILLISASIVIAFSYENLDRTIRRLTDFFLFQREYDRQELLRKLGKGVSESIDLEELQQTIRTTLQKLLRIEKIIFELSYDNKNKNVLWEELQANQRMLVYDEVIRELDENASGVENQRRRRVVERMRSMDLAVVLPLLAREGLVGMILLGEKKGGDAYTSSDLEILEALMYQAGVAMENAALFAKTQRFNIRLQKEVKVATHGLEVRNRRMSVLRKLDHIVLNTLDRNELAQQVVDLVSWEMGFNGALMVLVEYEGDQKMLRAVALSAAPAYKKALEILPVSLNKLKLQFDLDPSNVFCQSIREKKPINTSDFTEIYSPPLNRQVAQALQKATRTKHLVSYPILARGNALGAIAFDLPKPLENLSHDDQELISAFMDEVGIAFENIRLYDEVQRRNEELSVANFKLKELDQMKDELVSVASHELRTPMTVIKSYLWMALNKHRESLDEKMIKYLERAFDSSERMINLVNDMLSASRLEGKRVELHTKPQDMVEIIDGVVTELKTKAKERDLKLNFKKPEINVPEVQIDEERIFEVLMNVIGNSIKYTEKGHIDVSVSLQDEKSGPLQKLRDVNDPKYVWVVVKDTGRGIDKEDIPRLFKKFGRLDQDSFSKMAEVTGTGLGLYITKGLVELHGGEIWVESKKGKGSTFAFSVRVAKN